MKIGIVSDAHGNYRSLKRCLNYFKSLNVSHVYYLGDAIGYLPNIEVLDELINLKQKVSCILGNHEDMFLNYFEIYKKEDVYCANLLNNNIKRNHINFIGSWPKFISLKINNIKLLFVHGNPNDYTYGYLYEDSDFTQFKTSYDYIFMGHTHIPFIKKYNNTYYVNVGSCGLPRDFGSSASCVIFDLKNKDLNIFRYDISDIIRLVKKENFGLADQKVLKVFDR